MSKWVLRFRAADKKNFLEVKHDLKTVETRAATERYRKIKAGDKLVFVCGRLRLVKLVKRARRFRTISEMVRVIGYKKIMPSVQSVGELRKAYYGYSGYREKIKKFGIVAFELA